MVTKIIADLPHELCDKSLFDLAIRGRSRGDKIIMWEENLERLTVLFDGRVGYSLEDYVKAPFVIAPGAELLFNQEVLGCTSGDDISGLVLDAPNHTLSYHFQQRWGGAYEKEAKNFNNKQIALPLQCIWAYYYSMNFTWYQSAEDIDEVFSTFQGFESLITASLAGLETHIPLVEDRAELVSMN